MTISPRFRLNLISLVLICVVLGIAPVVVITGCRTQTREAAAYNSFRTTWDVTHAAYQAWCAQVVSGKVSPVREQQGDLAWNLFRSSFRRAFVAASSNWNSPVGTNVLSNKEAFLNSIK